MPTLGAHLFGGQPAHLHTGELPTGVIHAKFSNPGFVPPEDFEVMVPKLGGVSSIKMTTTPRMKDLPDPPDVQGSEIQLPFESECFSIFVVRPMDLAVSVSTYLTPEDEMYIVSTMRQALSLDLTSSRPGTSPS